MAVWPMAEAFVDEYIAYLVANLETKISALNTEYADQLLENIAEESVYKGEIDLNHVANWPAIFVLVEGSTLDQGHHEFMQQTLDVNASVLVLDQDSEKLREKIYRYTRAIIELLMEGHEAGSISWHPKFDGASTIRYSPLYTDGTSFMRDAQFRVQVWKREVG